MENKEKCGKCGMKIAVWVYMPGYSDGGNPYSCDDCISSINDVGCSCNWRYSKHQDVYDEQPEGIEGKDWRWVIHEGNEYMNKITKEEGIWQKLDERGRPWPCGEYDYDKDGFDIEEPNDKFSEDQYDR